MSKEKVKKSPKQELKEWLTVIVIGAVLVIGILISSISLYADNS